MVTFNRRRFFRLHAEASSHAGIIVCTRDDDVFALADRIHQQLRKVLDRNMQQGSVGKLLGAFAQHWGLSAAQIIVEGTSRNTYENAVNTAALLRAAAAFHAQGMVADRLSGGASA